MNWIKKFQKGGGRCCIDSIYNANQNVPFIKRIMEGNKKSIPSPNDSTRTSTHLLSQMDEYAFPEIQSINGELKYLPGKEGFNMAIKNKNVIKFNTPEEALNFTKHYKESTPWLENWRREYSKNTPISIRTKLRELTGLPARAPRENSKLHNNHIQKAIEEFDDMDKAYQNLEEGWSVTKMLSKLGIGSGLEPYRKERAKIPKYRASYIDEMRKTFPEDDALLKKYYGDKEYLKKIYGVDAISGYD